MFIATRAARTAKLRRSGMCSPLARIQREIRGDQTRIPCRSYGAWRDVWAGLYYKHGAPNGACPVRTAGNVCKAQALYPDGSPAFS
ncbi:MAG: hypothetical protein QOJ40_3158 [Verrucomicrobiota bacterium]